MTPVEAKGRSRRGPRPSNKKQQNPRKDVAERDQTAITVQTAPPRRSARLLENRKTTESHKSALPQEPAKPAKTIKASARKRTQSSQVQKKQDAQPAQPLAPKTRKRTIAQGQASPLQKRGKAAKQVKPRAAKEQQEPEGPQAKPTARFRRTAGDRHIFREDGHYSQTKAAPSKVELLL